MHLENTIKRYYNLDIISIKKNEKSTDGNVYNIITLNNRYIAKIYDNINKANSMILLHNYLETMYIPRIVKNNSGHYLTKYNDKYIIIFTFLEGMQISTLIKENNGIYSDDDIKLIAKEVRKMHDLTSDKNFSLDKIEFANNLNRKSIIHFDLTKENIFITNKQIGFIDFDDAKYGDSVCDVAILLSFLFISKKRGIDNKNINLFLDSYYNKNEQELRKIEQGYIKLYIREWIKYILKGHQFDTSLKNSFEFKKNSVDNIDLFYEEFNAIE